HVAFQAYRVIHCDLKMRSVAAGLIQLLEHAFFDEHHIVDLHQVIHLGIEFG
ncbi:MAG: hypothetical protein ACI9ZF_002037, partial [Bradyrhizobium sp.]